jgi:hypothetical protein
MNNSYLLLFLWKKKKTAGIYCSLRSNARSLISATDFGQTSSKLAEIGQNSTHGCFLCAGLAKIRSVWNNFGQF